MDHSWGSAVCLCTRCVLAVSATHGQLRGVSVGVVVWECATEVAVMKGKFPEG